MNEVYCRACRAKIVPDADFCPKCGADQRRPTTAPQKPISRSYRVKMKDGREVGPVSLEIVYSMLDQGTIDKDTPIRVDDTGGVIFADELPPIVANVQPLPRPAASPNTYAPTASRPKAMSLSESASVAFPKQFRIVAIILACFAGCSMLSLLPKPDPSPTDAEIMARTFVKRSLKSPTTAQFPDDSDAPVTSERIDGETKWQYRVTGYVDSQNGFGAMVRSKYHVTLHPKDQSGDSWVCDDIRIDSL
jgi:ribosomal protein L40E